MSKTEISPSRKSNNIVMHPWPTCNLLAEVFLTPWYSVSLQGSYALSLIYNQKACL